jgi:hypothetical protein
MTHEYAYKDLLSLLSDAEVKLPILGVGFCRGDTVEAVFSNEKEGGQVRRRKNFPGTNRALLTRLVSQAEASQAAYLFMRDSCLLVSKQEAQHLADNHLQGLDILSMHCYEPTRYHSDQTFKATLRDSTLRVEVKHFNSSSGQELKDARLIQKVMLLGRQLSSAMEKLTGLKVWEQVWEVVIDEENRAKLVNVEVFRLCSTAPPIRKMSEARVAEGGDIATDQVKQGKAKMTDRGTSNFLEVLYKRFENAEIAKDTQARLNAIKQKHFSESAPSANAEDRLQMVLVSGFPSTSNAPSKVATRAQIIDQVHSLLQLKTASHPKKVSIMKPISFQRRKHLMPTKMDPTGSEVRNTAVSAVNKFRKERLTHLELPHYSIKHSLNPSSPAIRLISLLCTEEQTRLTKKTPATPMPQSSACWSGKSMKYKRTMSDRTVLPIARSNSPS